MAKPRHSSRRHKRSNKHKRSNGVKRGGNGNYTSASSYGTYVNGSGDEQFNRVFNNSSQSNVLVGAQGQWGQPVGNPSASNLSLVQSAGKSRKRRGGLFGEVISQAVVPFGILGLQQTYRKNRKGGKSRKHRKH